MAHATKSTKVVTKTVEEKVDDGVNLHLTDDEAQYLMELTGNLPWGPNGMNGAIYTSLKNILGFQKNKFVSNASIVLK